MNSISIAFVKINVVAVIMAILAFSGATFNNATIADMTVYGIEWPTIEPLAVGYIFFIVIYFVAAFMLWVGAVTIR